MTRRAMLLAVAGLGALAAVASLIVSPRAVPRSWQGWIEANFLFIGPDEAGRITSLPVAEGQQVAPGDPLFTVESEIQEAEYRQAKAALDEAEARLARAEAAQQRPEEIAVLEAQRARAQAALEQSKPELERAQKLLAQGVSPQSRVDQAQATYNRDLAQLRESERQIEVARLKAHPDDIAAAREVAAQARARLAAAETRRRQRRVLAPAAGRIQEVFFRTGEIVPAGRPVIALLPPGNVKVRFFVPQAELPRLAAGETVSVSCDGCPNDLMADITFVSGQAEFTPPVIYSPDERAKLVFRVEARPHRPELVRVGQPVTVTLAPAQKAEAADARR